MKAISEQDIGRIVVIRFADHGENTGHAPLMEAIGRVTAVKPGEVTIRAWGAVDDAESLQDSETAYVIVPSCIRRVRRLSK